MPSIYRAVRRTCPDRAGDAAERGVRDRPSAVASFDHLPEVRTRGRLSSDRVDLGDHHFSRPETGAQDRLWLGAVGHIRSDGSRGVPERVRNGLHGHHRARIQANPAARERAESIVQVRAVILIALLAIVRKLIILDISPGDAPQLLALAVATLSLGGVYWLVRDQERRERD